MPTVQDLTRLLEAAAPLAYQESYDNAGLQCGLPSAEITGVLLALDCTPAVIDEAVVWGRHRLKAELAPGYNPDVRCMVRRTRPPRR